MTSESGPPDENESDAERERHAGSAPIVTAYQDGIGAALFDVAAQSNVAGSVARFATRGLGRLAGLAQDAASALPDPPGLSAVADLMRDTAGSAVDLAGALPGVAQAVGEGVVSTASAVDLGAIGDAAGSVAGAALEGAAGIVGDILNA